MTGSCHCSRVTVTLAEAPDYINLCDCSLCWKSGGAWGYFDETEVRVTGETSAYRRVDKREPAVRMRFCARCGTTTHWQRTEHYSDGLTGVNMRIFTPTDIAGIEVRTLDGRNWQGDTIPGKRCATGLLGENVFL
ncbi:MAG: GFA family protein [Parerythrobacter sp.]